MDYGKLIELLNEYENYLDTTNRDDIQVHFSHINWADVKCFHNYSLIISKRYLFIKWLVDNDKIVDFVDKKETLVSLRKWNTSPLGYVEIVTPKYEQLLMLLAIKDEPIEFLISILK